MILIFSDLHLDNYRHFSTTVPGGINSRLMDQVKVVNQVRKIAETQHPEAIVFLGDLFNGQGANINKLLYLTGHHLVDQLQQVAPLYLIVGNHDMYGGQHILGPLGDMTNVTIVAESNVYPLLGQKVAMVPWGGTLPPEGDIVLGHLDIEGAKTGIGYELAGTMSVAQFKRYKLVIAGHYHSYQTLTPNIIYCGAVMPITFGDVAEEDYGCIELDSDLNPVRTIISSPKFIPIRINTQSDLDRFVENKQKNYYRLTVTDRKIKIPKFDHTVQVEVEVEEQLTSRLEYTYDTPLEEILIKYIDSISTRVDKAQAKALLQEIMQEC